MKTQLPEMEQKKVELSKLIQEIFPSSQEANDKDDSQMNLIKPDKSELLSIQDNESKNHAS